MKTIGLMGGMGWLGSAAYYQAINLEVRARLGGWHCARIIFDSLNFHDVASAQSKDDYQEVQRLLIASALRLEKAGAEVLIIACNTVHRLAPKVQDAIAIPFLHIADAAGQLLSKDKHTKVGLLGTKATMQATFYSKRLSDTFGLEMIAPKRETQDLLQDLALHKLSSHGNPTQWRPIMDKAVEELKHQGCSAILLACTEFASVYGAPGLPVIEDLLPIYDTSIIHAHAAVDFSLQ